MGILLVYLFVCLFACLFLIQNRKNRSFKNEGTHFLGLHHRKEKGKKKGIRKMYSFWKEASTQKNKASHSEGCGLEINAMLF